MEPLVDHLHARGGATFGPRGWPILDAFGSPLRDPAGLDITAQVRDRPGGPIRHEFRTDGTSPNITLALVTLPGDPIPVVVALLFASAAETAAWTWRCLPYDVLVTYGGRTDPVVGGDFTVHPGITR